MTEKSLSEDEFLLVRETKKQQMAELDEDELLLLHARVRRARNKYVKLYRRAGAEKVGKKKSRAAGKNANVRNAAKAEVFENALARVSRQLGAVARASAESLKQERLARARRDSFVPGAAVPGSGAVSSPGVDRVDRTRESPGRMKYEASTSAAGARRQAKKDDRHS